MKYIRWNIFFLWFCFTFNIHSHSRSGKDGEETLSTEQHSVQQSQFDPNHICALLDLCMMTTYFQYRESFYWQQHSCTMSTVSPIVANLCVEEFESRALITFIETAPSHWFRYVEDSWAKIRTGEVEAFTEHINAVDSNIKYIQEDVRGGRLPLLDCAGHIEEASPLKCTKNYTHR